jgi:excisionase family DNA binding protein
MLPSINASQTVYARPSARVAVVAGLMDCHPSEIRRLINSGDLEAHRTGIRGIRIFLDSVQLYQERRTCVPKSARREAAVTKPRVRTPTAAFQSAMSNLKAKGLI